MTGMLLAILTYRPIYDKIYQTADVGNRPDLSVVDINVVPAASNTVEVTHVYSDGSFKTQTKLQMADGGTELKQEPIKVSTHLSPKSFWLLVFLVFIQVIY